MDKHEIEELNKLIREVADFPSPGILFKDITPLLRDASAFGRVIHEFERVVEEMGGVDQIAGVEARGFIFAAALAQKMGKGFIPIRKSGKLPAASFSASYSLEYGESTLQIHQDAVLPGERVLIIDDVLATGGTLSAAVKLIQQCGGRVAKVCVLLEIESLGGREKFGALYPELNLVSLI